MSKDSLQEIFGPHASVSELVKIKDFDTVTDVPAPVKEVSCVNRRINLNFADLYYMAHELNMSPFDFMTAYTWPNFGENDDVFKGFTITNLEVLGNEICPLAAVHLDMSKPQVVCASCTLDKSRPVTCHQPHLIYVSQGKDIKFMGYNKTKATETVKASLRSLNPELSFYAPLHEELNHKFNDILFDTFYNAAIAADPNQMCGYTFYSLLSYFISLGPSARLVPPEHFMDAANQFGKFVEFAVRPTGFIVQYFSFIGAMPEQMADFMQKIIPDEHLLSYIQADDAQVVTIIDRLSKMKMVVESNHDQLYKFFEANDSKGALQLITTKLNELQNMNSGVTGKKEN